MRIRHAPQRCRLPSGIFRYRPSTPDQNKTFTKPKYYGIKGTAALGARVLDVHRYSVAGRSGRTANAAVISDLRAEKGQQSAAGPVR